MFKNLFLVTLTLVAMSKATALKSRTSLVSQESQETLQFLHDQERPRGPAPPCNEAGCNLPDCRCSSTRIPGGLSPQEVPQIVYISFNGALTSTSDAFFDELFGVDAPYLNPNGCRFRATHFVNHVSTDYRVANKWWTEGHEMAVRSISDESNITYWAQINQTGWEVEMDGMRTILSEFANIPVDSIQGMRAPYLQNGGDLQFGMLSDKGFLYDSSLPTKAFAYLHMSEAMWPYSMDYKSIQIEPCVYSSYPGIWEQPLLMLEDLWDVYGDGTGQPCSMLEQCQGYPDAAPHHISDMLKKNFDRAYSGNRAPFGIHLQAAFFAPSQGWHYEGFKMFMDYLTTFDDVFVVTMQEGLEFIRHPVPLKDIADFEPFQCQHLPYVADCSRWQRCHVSQLPESVGISGEKYMGICKSRCPSHYPWLENPLGL